jgi:hypothetical protein
LFQNFRSHGTERFFLVVYQFEFQGALNMETTFGRDEKMKAAEAVSRLIDESPVPTKIEIVKSERGLAVSSFGLTTEDEATTTS